MVTLQLLILAENRKIRNDSFERSANIEQLRESKAKYPMAYPTFPCRASSAHSNELSCLVLYCTRMWLPPAHFTEERLQKSGITNLGSRKSFSCDPALSHPAVVLQRDDSNSRPDFLIFRGYEGGIGLCPTQ